jgi:propionate catabolism operon transcriptional regulator
MPLAQQAKLLRVLQEKRIRPIGSTREFYLDFKVVAATNIDLRRAVDQGRFRDDLFYRLNVFSLKIPPLRQRREDIGAIARYYLDDYRQRYRLDFDQASLLAAVLPLFEHYSWPGNVRELQNFSERLVVNCAAAGMATVENNRLREILPELFSQEKKEGAASGELKNQEEKAIIEAMDRFDNDKNQVADYLGISATTLWRRLKNIHSNSNTMTTVKP